MALPHAVKDNLVSRLTALKDAREHGLISGADYLLRYAALRAESNRALDLYGKVPVVLLAVEQISGALSDFNSVNNIAPTCISVVRVLEGALVDAPRAAKGWKNWSHL